MALKHKDPLAGEFWGVPGGEIEPAETPLQAAIRETSEESGYAVELLYDPNLAVPYDFVWGNRRYHCLTHWYAVSPRQDCAHYPKAGDEEFITELRWLKVDNWKMLFPNHPVLQGAIETILNELQHRGLISMADS